ncbi:uncharacterized protein LOC113204533 [Frankliniella occidentalis]|uniref:Uncharacterized protein LOC113204533 n=1 Tax=Frankliniella occidentalis TaxID=133901 RepID=A0A6J1S4D9_FRAOC|nr:uncharacterized protein LOC113204533 [Frankliniella occidentalis]
MQPLLDDELIMVLQNVDVADLLTCRLVCKRLGGLALHPDVWRHRRLRCSLDPLHAPTLRLAPCLGEAMLVLRDGSPTPLYTETECAMAGLRVFMSGDGKEVLAKALLVVRNQLALGRLRSVSLVLDFEEVVDVHELFDLLASTCELEEIEITIRCVMTARWEPNSLAPPPRPSLKRLHCIRPDTHPFNLFMLKAHAATLEEFHFSPWGEWLPLPSMPNLRELEACAFSGMAALATCTKLRKAVLNVFWTDPCGKDAEEFLRRAHQLQSVSLHYTIRERGDALDLVLALAGRPGQSRLERLEIHDEHTECADYPHLPPLLAALPSLTALRHLELNAVVEGLAGSITPATAPALRTLRLTPVAGWKGVCAHAHLHKRSVQTLMADNPLVVLLMRARHFCLPEKYPCTTCALGCHQDMCAAQKRLADNSRCSWVNMNQFNIPPNDSPPN